MANPGVTKLLEDMDRLADRPLQLMEVCGTHTMAIARAGIKRMLPPRVKLLSGPGCPVCVTPWEGIDGFLHLTEHPKILLTTYGDMIRVPGSRPGDSLAARMAEGAKVQVVYSPVDALAIAAANPELEVVFLGVGFETTAPGTAATVRLAREQGLKNFSVLSLLKTVRPALEALMAAPDFAVDGFLCPGHVAVILGEEGFRFLPEEHHMPAVISGFEPEDILLSVHRLCRQLHEGTPRLENTYTRAVSKEGNAAALAMMREVLVPEDALWRGLGLIPGSGLGIAPAYRDFDARYRFGLEPASADRHIHTACRCGEVICGRISPTDCPLFGRVCLPEDPVGPCMVSGEGACAAAYKYQEI